MTRPERDPSADERAWQEIVARLSPRAGGPGNHDAAGQGAAGHDVEGHDVEGMEEVLDPPDPFDPFDPEDPYAHDSQDVTGEGQPHPLPPDPIDPVPPNPHQGIAFDPGPERDPLDPEDDWRPPDPGNVIHGLSAKTLIAWALLVVTPVVLVTLGYLLGGLPWWLWMPGLAVVISSIMTLLGGLPEHRDDTDDGARV